MTPEETIATGREQLCEKCPACHSDTGCVDRIARIEEAYAHDAVGASLPPIVVHSAPGCRWLLYDGRHRLWCARRHDLPEILACSGIGGPTFTIPLAELEDAWQHRPLPRKRWVFVNGRLVA